ncbi:MAG: methylmalonyl-CoA carboxyltransferase [Oscillospiraceae bacterium]|nr:methylmalonyl-CoA carboxyltransferase [Oscillospiraceae bacterium]
MDKYQDLQDRRAKLMLGGGADKIEAQHKKGKLTARERIDYFFDPGTFVELNAYVQHRCNDLGMEGTQVDGDGVVTGFGLVKGQRVFVFAQDFTYNGGSLGEMHAQKISKLQEKALAAGCPIVGLLDSGGARIQEGIGSLAGFGKIFYQNTMASGIIPQISVIMGPCAGGAVYSPALTDFVFMVENTSQMFLTGPAVIVTVTGEQVTAEELGGAATHTSKSGVAHFRAPDDKSCLDKVKNLISYLPSKAGAPLPKSFSAGNVHAKVDALNELLPDNSNKAYDMYDVIKGVVDDGEILDSHEHFARNLITCYARVDGTPVGIIANQPKVLAGCMDIDSSTKATRFVRTCDAFGIPVITLVDTSGFLPGTGQEYGGIIRHGAGLLYAYSEATVPKITIVTRKAYGGAYIAMCCRDLGADVVYAWPQAEIAVMGPEGAINIIYKRDIAGAENPDDKRTELVNMYKEKFSNPYVAANHGYVDDVIEPRETREKIIQALLMMRDKKADRPARKHGNIPF